MADRGRGGRGGGRGGRGGGGGGQGRGRGAPQGPPQGQGGAFRGGAFRGGGFGGAGGGAGFRGGGPPGRGGREPPRVYAPSPDGSPPLPDAKVTQVEDARQKARKTSDLSAAMGKLQLASPGGFMPPRPGYGTGGKNITVYANYTQLTPSSDLTLYAYDISEVKDDVAGRKRTQLMRLLVNESPELEGYRSHIVTDFKSTLISRKKLDLPTGVVDIVYKAEGEDEPLDRAKKYTIKIKYTKTLRVSDLMTYLTSTNPAAGQQYDNKLEMIQALNILFNHYVKSSPDKLATIGASKTFSLDTTDLENRCNLGQGLHAIRGFFTSVRAATNRILVNVNVSHGAFYQEGELQSLMEAYRGANAHHDRNTQGAGQYNDYILRRLNMFLKKVRVRTIHLPVKTNKKGEIVARMKSIFALASPKDGFEMKRRPRVQKLGAGPTAVEFWVEDTPFQGAPGPGAAASAQAPASAKKGKGKGKPPASNPQHAGAEAGRYVTVFDYFRSKYPHIRLNPNLPVVNVGTNGRPSYLPAEACIVLPGQNAMTKLDGRQTQQMIHFAVRGPWKNAESIVKPGFETAGLSANKNHLLAQFGIQVGNSLITVPARLLPEPTVLYRKFEPNSQPNSKAIQVMNGSWNMDKIKFNQPGRLQTWSWMAISISASARQEVTDTIVKFRAALVKNGVNAAVEIPGKHIEVPQVKDQIEQFDKLVAGNQKLLLIILPGRDKSDNTLLYSQIKKWGDTRFGVHTVCVIGHKFMGTKGQDQYFANVALKFNLKLGGNNQGIDPARLSFINQDKTMLVGIDVTHPSPGSHKDAPSVAGMVASTDRHLGQWPGTLRQQKGKQEKVDDLKDMLKHHLDNWKTIGKHQAYPENILVYRDGVSEGQYQIVVDQEIPLLREACREKYPPNGPPPRLTVVIVGKRHHTRFYPTKQQDMDRSGNCKAGTVVDRGVTEEGIWDFFLQSHAVIQGTGRPAHYVVVLDEIFRYQAQLKGKANISEAANELERVTQALCYSYSRATKAVSICTPAYHADILCERARRYMAGLFEESNSEDGSSVTKEKEWTIHPRLQNSMFYI